ncbi:MAG TPA: alpha/beta hydrolase, partial [Candidatus Limnocylindrales bacterium]|nr:alpha/beta hydrolase [Candidatus Limnocylindrales bacterium]
RSYGGQEVTLEEWARVFAVFGPRVPDEETMARRVRNPAVNPPGMDRMRALDVVDQLELITSPTLVVVGELEPGTPVEASREIFEALRPGIGRFEVVAGAGHFTWLDDPDRYWSVVMGFVRDVARGSAAAE